MFEKVPSHLISCTYFREIFDSELECECGSEVQAWMFKTELTELNSTWEDVMECVKLEMYREYALPKTQRVAMLIDAKVDIKPSKYSLLQTWYTTDPLLKLP